MEIGWDVIISGTLLFGFIMGIYMARKKFLESSKRCPFLLYCSRYTDWDYFKAICMSLGQGFKECPYFDTMMKKRENEQPWVWEIIWDKKLKKVRERKD